ncbi:Ger(x)C family spore germination protein [Natranaerofaba carboxydovora]|uniref:Ger(x)C family spore germination protein n=1 Tax=Natranaerofaba carboxydovora TaxID=2742683 RepID=UPI001F149683|nr:Ger(x)C family spore germination protein [Natranaerofaba carboxydovora]UMZ72622.1 Spore germination protein B3 [Natranaerofaba carboxydovora]
MKLCMFKDIYLYLIMIIMIISVFAIFYGAGCWDRREPEDSAFVLAMGFDYDEDEELYEIIVQIPDPQGAAGDPGGAMGGESPGVKVASGKGVTPFKAARNLPATRDVFFGQNKIVIFSEAAAKNGLGSIYDFLARERQARLVATPVILKGEESITQFLRTEVPLDEVLADALERQFSLIIEQRGIFPQKSLIDIFDMYTIVGKEPVMGKVKLGEQTEEDMIGEDKEAVKASIEIEGSGFFEGDSLKGWLDPDQTEGYLWLRGDLLRGLTVIKCPVHDEHPISIEVLNTDVNKIPVITEEGEAEVHLEVKADGRIQQQNCPATYERHGELSEALDRRFATVIENNIKETIEVAQEKNVDFLGFGNLFYRKKYNEWTEEDIGENWEEIFEDLTVKTDIDANVRRAGLIQAPIIRE